MTQFKAFTPGVEIAADGFLAFINAAGAFQPKVLDILAAHGIKNPQPGQWVPLQSCLDVYREFHEKIGENYLFMVGKKIPEAAVFPPQVDSFATAMGAIDMAYHMNERKDGVVMFDMATGKMLEGIGHYHFKPLAVETKRAVMVCENPFPCDFDRGLIEGMAKRFKPVGALMVKVEHDDSQPCRKKGASSCNYNISW